MLRMVYDEPVRYKLAQLIGNLSLCSVNGSQGIPVGHITAYNASPALQLSFVKMMMEEVDRDDFTGYADVIEQQAAWVAMKYGDGEAEHGLGGGSSSSSRRRHTSVGGQVEIDYGPDDGEDDDDDESLDDEDLLDEQ